MDPRTRRRLGEWRGWMKPRGRWACFGSSHGEHGEHGEEWRRGLAERSAPLAGIVLHSIPFTHSPTNLGSARSTTSRRESLRALRGLRVKNQTAERTHRGHFAGIPPGGDTLRPPIPPSGSNRTLPRGLKTGGPREDGHFSLPRTSPPQRASSFFGSSGDRASERCRGGRQSRFGSSHGDHGEHGEILPSGRRRSPAPSFQPFISPARQRTPAPRVTRPRDWPPSVPSVVSV